MRRAAPTDETGYRDRVVGRAERTPAHQRAVTRQQPRDRPDRRGFDHLVAGQRGQDRRQPARQHRLSPTRRTDEQESVVNYEPKGYRLILQAPQRRSATSSGP